MNKRLFTLLIFAVTACCMSCKNKDLVPATPATTTLNVVNASPDTIKYYINGTRQNENSNIFVGGQTGYLSVITGTQNYKFSNATGNFATLFTTQFTLDTSVNYSLFVAGTTPENAFLLVDPLTYASTLLTPDTLTNLLNPSAIRFVNASPDAGNLNVTVGVGDTVNFNNCKFGTQTSFVPFNAATKEVKVFTNNGTTLSIDTMLTFNSFQVYTLFTKGTLNGKGSSFYF
jgi:hypothetical protein